MQDLRRARQKSCERAVACKLLILLGLAGSTGLEPAASGVTGRSQRQHNAADPGKSGSAVPSFGRSIPIVDACSGKSCKFLQAGHEGPRSAAMLEHRKPRAPIRPTRGLPNRLLYRLKRRLMPALIKRARRVLGRIVARVDGTAPSAAIPYAASASLNSTFSNVTTGLSLRPSPFSSRTRP
jgi:hypothetical protein